VNGLLPPDHDRGWGFAVIEKKIVHKRIDRKNKLNKKIYLYTGGIMYIKIIVKNKNR